MSVAAFLLLAAAGGSALAQERPAADLLTLDQALALGAAQNRSIQRATEDVGRAEDAAAAMKSRRNPAFEVNFLESRLLSNVDFRFPRGAFGTFPAPIGPIPGADTTVTTDASWISVGWLRATQPISQLHRIGLATRLIGYDRDLALEQVRARRLAVADDVRRAYYGILQGEGGIVAREKSLALHREIGRLVDGYLAEQLALPADALQVKATVAKEEAALAALRNTVATLHEQLNLLLGRDVSTPFTVGPAPEPAVDGLSLDELEARALVNRPEVRQAALAVERAKQDVRVTGAAGLPEVSAIVSLLGFGRFDVLPPAVASAGVFVTWEPFDWGRRGREIAGKQRVVVQAESTGRDAEGSVRLDVRRAFRKLAEARDAVRVAELAQEAGREKVRVALARHEEERVLLRAVLEAQAELAGIDQQHIEALLTLGTARADLTRAVGGQ